MVTALGLHSGLVRTWVEKRRRGKSHSQRQFQDAAHQIVWASLSFGRWVSDVILQCFSNSSAAVLTRRSFRYTGRQQAVARAGIW